MELGQKLKAIRTSKSITLQQVADGANLSKSFVSQVETSAANPSVGSLKRIAQALGIPLAALFDDADGRAGPPPVPVTDADGTSHVRVVRQARRKMLVWPGSAGKTYLLTPDLQRKLEVLLSIEEPGHGTGDEWYSHEGEEFGFILEGCYEVTVGAQVFILEQGDSIYFPSHLLHKGRVLGEGPAKTLWVITPPSF